MKIRIEQQGFQIDGKSTFLLGTSYLQPESSIAMWEQDSLYETTDRDFAHIADLGMNTVKLFLFWGVFYPDPDGELNEKALKLLDETIACAKKHHLYLIIDLMVGHMAGENYDIPWRDGRDLMKDPYMLRREASYIERMVSRYRDEKTILIWDVCNEITLYRNGRRGRSGEHPALYSYSPLGYLGDPPEVDESYMWLQNLIAACRRGDPNHPAYTGVGTALGFPVRDTAHLTDLYACYVYPNGSHKSSYLTGFETALANADGVPCLIEEFGASKTLVSARYEAYFYRMVLYSSLMRGSVGALSWVYSDFDLVMDRSPYLYHSWETHFGMIREDGSEYPCCQVVREFSAFLKTGILDGLELRKPDVYILVGESYDEPHAFNSFGIQEGKPIFFETYCRLTNAGLRVAILREYDLDYMQAPMICIPCQGGGLLKSTTWQKIRSYVFNGGKLLLSGTSDNAGPYCNELFGVEKYGDFRMENPSMEIREDFYGLHAGETIDFTGSKTYCKLDGVKGTVVGTAGDETLIAAGSYGKGKTVFIPFPIESCSVSEHSKETFQRLYKAVCRYLDVWPPICYDGSDAELGIFENQGHDLSIVLLLNHSFLSETVGTLSLNRIPAKILDLDTGERLSFKANNGLVELPIQVDLGSVRKIAIHWNGEV